MTRLAKWQAESAAQGWTFERKVGSVYAAYTHDTCGRERQAQLGAMRKGLVRCNHCKEMEWRVVAISQGWRFERNVNGQYAVYLHNVCGQEQQSQISTMSNNRVRCRYCMEQAWRNEATAQGWTFVAQSGWDCATYVHKSCGHQQKAQLANMRIANVVCHGCGESWANNPSNVYLLDITTACSKRFLKLGFARVVLRRAGQYGLAKGAKIKLLYAKAYATGVEARKIEKMLHKMVKNLNPSVKKFNGAKKLMASGYTECYEYSPKAVKFFLLNLQSGDICYEPL